MSRLQRLQLLIALFCTLGLLAGCSQLRFPAAFRIDVAQGNILEKEKVEQLQPGMTQRQVLYLLGSPVLKDTLDPNVWRYAYQFSKSGDAPKRYQIILRFDDAVLQDIEGDFEKIKAWHKIL